MAADLLYRYKPLPPVGTQPFVHILDSFKNGTFIGLLFGINKVILGKPTKFGVAAFTVAKLTLSVAAVPTCYTTTKFIITNVRGESYPWLNDLLSIYPTSLLVWSMTGSKVLKTSFLCAATIFTLLRIRAKLRNEEVAFAKSFGRRDETAPKFYVSGYGFEKH